MWKMAILCTLGLTYNPQGILILHIEYRMMNNEVNFDVRYSTFVIRYYNIFAYALQAIAPVVQWIELWFPVPSI